MQRLVHAVQKPLLELRPMLHHLQARQLGQILDKRPDEAIDPDQSDVRPGNGGDEDAQSGDQGGDHLGAEDGAEEGGGGKGAGEKGP